jgi:undecaprenol kinase
VGGDSVKNRPFHERIGFALDGIRAVWLSERSFRTQCGCALAAAAVTLALRPGWIWAALIAISTALVLALELLNSALEYLIDHVHPDIAPAIKRTKDAAAGAVLLASFGALCVGLMMLLSVVFG